MRKPPVSKREIEPRLLSRTQAAAYLGIGVPLFDRECLLAPIKLGGRLLWDRHALDAWIDVISGALRPDLDYDRTHAETLKSIADDWRDRRAARLRRKTRAGAKEAGQEISKIFARIDKRKKRRGRPAGS